MLLALTFDAAAVVVAVVAVVLTLIVSAAWIRAAPSLSLSAGAESEAIPVVSRAHRGGVLYDPLHNWRLSTVYGARFRLGSTLVLNEAPSSCGVAVGSSRVPSYAAGERMSRGRRIVLQPYGRVWQAYHAALVPLLGLGLREVWDAAMAIEAEALVRRLSERDADVDLVAEAHRYTAAVTVRAVYGRPADDAVLRGLQASAARMAHAFAHWSDRSRWAASLPPFRGRWDAFFRQDEAMFTALLDGVRDGDCCAAHIPHRDAGGGGGGGGGVDRAYVAATIIEAGSETTGSTLVLFLLAAACFPAAVGDEVDVRAIVRECLRLTPAGSSGMLHIHPDGGERVLPNTYGIHHHPDMGGWAFDPTRHAQTQAQAQAQAQAQIHAFGFGKRRCPGAQVATRSLTTAVQALRDNFTFSLTPHAEVVRKHAIQRLEEDYKRWPDLTAKERQLRAEAGPNAALLDAYTLGRISRHDVARCIQLHPRT